MMSKSPFSHDKCKAVFPSCKIINIILTILEQYHIDYIYGKLLCNHKLYHFDITMHTSQLKCSKSILNVFWLKINNKQCIEITSLVSLKDSASHIALYAISLWPFAQASKRILLISYIGDGGIVKLSCNKWYCS